MEKISGGPVVEMQVISIAARMDDDLKRVSSATEEERKEREKNKNTGRIFGKLVSIAKRPRKVYGFIFDSIYHSF